MLNETQQKWLLFGIGLLLSLKNTNKSFNPPVYNPPLLDDEPVLSEEELISQSLDDDMVNDYAPLGSIDSDIDNLSEIGNEEEGELEEGFEEEEEEIDTYGMPNPAYVRPGKVCPDGQVECCTSGGIQGGSPDCYCASPQDCLNHESSTSPFGCQISNIGVWADSDCVNVDRVASLPYYNNMSGNNQKSGKTNYFNPTRPLNNNGYIQFNGQSEDWSGGLNTEGETITYTDFTEEIP